MSQDICRICENVNNLKNLFLHENINIISKILTCANVSIEKNDHLPKFICDKCEINLETAYNFKEQCELNDRKWRIFVELKDNQNSYDENYNDNLIIETNDRLINYQENNNTNDNDDDDNTYANIIEIDDNNYDENENNEIIKRNNSDNEHEILILDEGVNNYYKKLENIEQISQLYLNTILKNENDKNETLAENYITEEDCIEYMYDCNNDDDEDDEDQQIIINYEKHNDDNSLIEEIYSEESQNRNQIEELNNSVGKCKKINESSDNDASSNNTKMKFSTIGSKIFECDTCHEKFSFYSEFNQHKKSHGNQRYQCTKCLKWFSKRFRLNNHLLIHNENKKFYKCDKCDNKYTNQGNLDRHIRHFHNNVRPYVCTECGLSFSRSHTFNIHQTVHTKERNYECEICNKRFKALYYLRVHKKTHLPKELRKKSSSSSSSKSVKSSKIRLSENIKCQYCGKLSKTKGLHVSHMRMHTGEKPFVCKYCGKAFAFRPSLRVHEFVHTGEKPYKCKLCGLSFRQFAHLKGHNLIHSGVKNYKCDYCEKMFALKSNLVVHLRLHTGEKPHKCGVCNKKFYDSNAFRRHKQKHINNDVAVQNSTLSVIDEEINKTAKTSSQKVQKDKHDDNGWQKFESNLIELIKGKNVKL